MSSPGRPGSGESLYPEGYSDSLSLMPRWELGDEFELVIGSWVRRVRVVGVTGSSESYAREYTLREVDQHGNHVFQPEADEEVIDADRVVRSYPVVEGRRQGGVVPEGRHEDRSEVGDGDGARRQQEFGSGFAGSGGEGGRAEADGEGFDGPVGEGRVRPQQAGLAQGLVGSRPEGPVLGHRPGLFVPGCPCVTCWVLGRVWRRHQG